MSRGKKSWTRKIDYGENQGAFNTKRETAVDLCKSGNGPKTT